jgi:hypothetical protein
LAVAEVVQDSLMMATWVAAAVAVVLSLEVEY